MSTDLVASDLELLYAIGDYRVLTIRHLATILHRNSNALRRRLRFLGKAGLTQTVTQGLHGRHGRPEGLLSLSLAGADVLLSKGMVDSNVPPSRLTVAPATPIGHELLVNEFRIQVTLLERAAPGLSATFFPNTSPISTRPGEQWPSIREEFEVPGGGHRTVEFVPDGVVAITCRGLRKTLLFFLEADRGTEPLSSRRSPERSFLGKINNYKSYFQIEGYRRYEDFLSTSLQGFRLLVLADAPGRMANLCRLVREEARSEFVWLAEREDLIDLGVWGSMWIPGGRSSEPTQSILGSKSAPTVTITGQGCVSVWITSMD